MFFKKKEEPKKLIIPATINRTLKIGDGVYLKHHTAGNPSPLMTVAKLKWFYYKDDDGDIIMDGSTERVECNWFVDGKLQRAKFLADALVKLETKPPKKKA